MMTTHEKGMAIAAIPVENGRVTREQAVEIAGILGDVASFRHFDSLADSGSRLADEYGCWKVRQARNLSVDGVPVFFDALVQVGVAAAAKDVAEHADEEAARAARIARVAKRVN